MTCCLPGSSPTRHFDRPEDPGDEVVSPGDAALTKEPVDSGYEIGTKISLSQSFSRRPTVDKELEKLWARDCEQQVQRCTLANCMECLTN